MNYEDYTLETLNMLGIHKILRGSEYIVSGIEYLFSQDKPVAPDSEIIYEKIARQFFLEPTAVENSMRNAIQTIWSNKENPKLMSAIFGPHNMDKRPCNMEFLILLYNYVRLHFEGSDNLKRLDEIWEESKRAYVENKKVTAV